MIDGTTSFILVLKDPRNPNKVIGDYPIIGLKMGGYPDPKLKEITYMNGHEEVTVDFARNTMLILESPKTDSIIKIRIPAADGKVWISQNRQFTDVEVLGLFEIGKASYIKGMFDNFNKKQIVQN